jgi:hypothetical protein
VSRITGPASIALIGVLALGACSQPTGAPKATGDAPPTAAAPAAAAGAKASEYTLPISLNAVMVSAVDYASDGLFDVGNAVMNQGKLPSSDAEWRQVQYHAYQMVLMGKVIQMPGTGPRDVEWTSAPTWKTWAESLGSVGKEMLGLVEARNASGFVDAGNRLVAVCEGCHKEFKPDIPTMKIFHKPHEETLPKK